MMSKKAPARRWTGIINLKKKAERNVYAYNKRFKMTGSDTKMTFGIIASYILTVFFFYSSIFYFHHRMDRAFRIRMDKTGNE